MNRIREHKNFLSRLEEQYQALGRKFEAGTILDFEIEMMTTLADEIKQRRQELQGFI